MAFNSNTYHANKHSREAFAGIAKAKDVKRRAALGQAYDWEIARIKHLVAVARGSMRLCLLYRSMRQGQIERAKSWR